MFVHVPRGPCFFISEHCCITWMYITVGLFIQSFPHLTTFANLLNHRATGPLGMEEGSYRPYLPNSTPTLLISNACYTAHKAAQPFLAYLQLQAAHSRRTKCLLNFTSLACKKTLLQFQHKSTSLDNFTKVLVLVLGLVRVSQLPPPHHRP